GFIGKFSTEIDRFFIVFLPLPQFYGQRSLWAEGAKGNKSEERISLPPPLTEGGEIMGAREL
ncbi:hypothetical protein EV693_1121, partial [Nicoletella semolina]